MDIAVCVIALIIATGLGFIPASIAKKKGYNKYALWWFYGWMLFIVAIIHAACLPDKTVQTIPIQSTSRVVSAAPVLDVGQSAADELKKYKELLDIGVLTQEEFDARKVQLLKYL